LYDNKDPCKGSRRLDSHNCNEHVSKNWNLKFWLIVKTLNPFTLSLITENDKDKKEKDDTHSLIFFARPSNNMLQHMSSSCSQKWCNLCIDTA
jgi:hypothetical protein